MSEKVIINSDYKKDPGIFWNIFGRTRLVWEESRNEIWTETFNNNCWAVWNK